MSAHLGDHDTLYFCHPIAGFLAVPDVTAAGMSNFRVTSAPCQNAAIAIDASGNALVASGSALRLVSPAGAFGGRD